MNYNLGNYSDSIEDCKSSIANGNNRAKACLFLARSYKMDKEPKNSYFREVIELYENSKEKLIPEKNAIYSQGLSDLMFNVINKGLDKEKDIEDTAILVISSDDNTRNIVTCSRL